MNWNKILGGFVCLILAFFTGALAGGFTGRLAGEGQMLAGGAIIAFHLLIGGVLGLVIAGFLVRKLSGAQRWKLALGLMISTALLVALTRYAIEQRRIDKEAARRELSHKQKTLSPAAPADTDASVFSEQGGTDTPAIIDQIITPDRIDRGQDVGATLKGLGLVSIPFGRDGVRLHFYPDGGWESQASDSLVYARENNQNVLQYAPPYLVPFYLKEDYDSMLLRLLGVSGNRVLVELNAAEGRRAWVDRQAVDLQYWPDFLATIFAVYPLDRQENPVRIKAQDSASEVSGIAEDDFLLPDVVVGDWVHVRAMTEGDSEAGFSGWLRWRRGEMLLVGWNYRL